MTQPAKDFWARADRKLLESWPKDEAGAPEAAARLDIQWELDSRADITVSFLQSCGIPAFQNGFPRQGPGGLRRPGGGDLGPRLPAGGGPGPAERTFGSSGAGLTVLLPFPTIQSSGGILAWTL